MPLSPIIAYLDAIPGTRAIVVKDDGGTLCAYDVSRWGVRLEETRTGFLEGAAAGTAVLIPLDAEGQPMDRHGRLYGYAYPGETPEAAVERIERPWKEAKARVAAARDGTKAGG